MLRFSVLILLVLNIFYFIFSYFFDESAYKNDNLDLVTEVNYDAINFYNSLPKDLFNQEKKLSELTTKKIDVENYKTVELNNDKLDKNLIEKINGNNQISNCIMLGNFNKNELDKLELTLGNYDKNRWQIKSIKNKELWMVYLGKFNDNQELNNTINILKSKRIDYAKTSGFFALGLSLGRFSTKEAAENQKIYFLMQGIPDVQVVLERPAIESFILYFYQASQEDENFLKNNFLKSLKKCN